MNTERWQKIERIFDAALELDETSRGAFIDEACKDDDQLKQEVEALLAETANDSTLLESPQWNLGLSLMSGEDDLLAGTELGPFKIVSRLGGGGMGEVYRAEDQRLKRMVALKILLRSLSDRKSLIRFRLEARAASAVSHPNIAHIYEIGEADGRVYIAMEFIDGGTLGERMNEKRIEPADANSIARQIALAMQAAHSHGIIHRDIKPDNVMIARSGIVKILDFGLAKLTERKAAHQRMMSSISTALTDPQLVLGTSHYMSPEQARGGKVDERTDIWSWGVVFYEMLAGIKPFVGESRSDVIAEILKTEPNFGLGLVDPRAAEVLRKALEKDREKRYSSADQLIETFDRAFAPAQPNQPVKSKGGFFRRLVGWR